MPSIESCKEETSKRLSEPVLDHPGRGTRSYIVRHCLNTDHETTNIKTFKILNMVYNINTYKRRIFEDLFVKQYHPSVNMQDNSIPLELFN